MKEYLLGIDIGTSKLKAGVIDDSGAVVTSLEINNSSRFDEKGRASQDVLSIVADTVELIREVCLKAGISSRDVSALGLDGQMGGIIGVDRDRKYGEKLISISCGSPRNTPKIAWWKRNESGVYRKVRRFTSLSGFVAGTLSGIKGDDAAIDETMIAYFGNENAEKREWSGELTSLWELDPEKMPKIGKPWDILGGVSTAASKETGLIEGIPIVLGAGDQPAGFLGGGLDKRTG